MQKRKKTYILEIRLVSDICDTLTDNMYTLGVTEKCMFRKIAYRWFSKEFSIYSLTVGGITYFTKKTEI